MEVKEMYVIYDSRACCSGDTDNALCLETCETLEEAKESAEGWQDFYGGCALYKYDVVKNAMINEEHIKDFI